MRSDGWDDSWMERRSFRDEHDDRGAIRKRVTSWLDLIQWEHDLYDDREQETKPDEEIISEYGYNIRECSAGGAFRTPLSYIRKSLRPHPYRREDKKKKKKKDKGTRTPAQDWLIAMRRAQDRDRTNRPGPMCSGLTRQVFFVDLPDVRAANPIVTYTAPLAMVPSQLVINFVKPEKSLAMKTSSPTIALRRGSNAARSRYALPSESAPCREDGREKAVGTVRKRRFPWDEPSELIPLRLPHGHSLTVGRKKTG